MDCRRSLETAREWAETGRFHGLTHWLKSEKPREVLHGCFALSFLVQRNLEDGAVDGGEAALDALTQALARFQHAPLVVAALIRALGALACWVQKRVSGREKLPNRTFTRIYTAIDAQPDNELVLVEFTNAMNLLFSTHGFKNHVEKVQEYLFGAALHVNPKISAPARRALCRMTWVSATLSEHLLQRAVEEFSTLLEGPWIPNRNVRLVGMLELIQSVLTSGGCDSATLHRRTIAGQKVVCGEHDAVLNVPLKKCRDLIDTVLDKTLHEGADVDQIREVIVNDCALGDVYRATLRMACSIVRVGSLPLVMERKWLTKLVLTLCSPVDIQVHYAGDVCALLSTIVETGYGVLFGTPLRKMEAFIQELLGQATDVQVDTEPKAKRARHGKNKAKTVVAKECRGQWRRDAFCAALRVWNTIARSALMQKVQAPTAARIHEVVVRVLWNGQSVAHSGVEKWFCEDVDELLDVLEIASANTPELRRVALGLCRSLGERGRKWYERMWRREAPCGPAFSRAYTEAMKKATASHAVDHVAVQETVTGDHDGILTDSRKKGPDLMETALDKPLDGGAEADQVALGRPVEIGREALCGPAINAMNKATTSPAVDLATQKSVVGGNHEAVLNVPQKKCPDLVDIVAEKTLHEGIKPDQIASGLGHSLVETGWQEAPCEPVLSQVDTDAMNKATASHAADLAVQEGNSVACTKDPISASTAADADIDMQDNELEELESDSEIPPLCMDSASEDK